MIPAPGDASPTPGRSPPDTHETGGCTGRPLRHSAANWREIERKEAKEGEARGPSESLKGSLLIRIHALEGQLGAAIHLSARTQSTRDRAHTVHA